MSLVSMEFMVFVLAVLFVYFIVPKRFQWMVLLAANFIFYLVAAAQMVGFLIFTTLTIYLCGIFLDSNFRKQSQEIKQAGEGLTREGKKEIVGRFLKGRRCIVTVACLITLGILVYLKYFNFIADNITNLLQDISIISKEAKPWRTSLLLPLGISFYTFQAVGYVIDVYREKIKAEHNPAKVMLFTSFFPQIIQGPISRFDQLGTQLIAPHDFDYMRVKQGIQLIVWGMFKKLVIADRAGILVTSVAANYTRFQGIEIACWVLFYMIQVYGDFSGGIDITRGVAQCMGIDMVQNFERPYLAVSLMDYWRRWHLTLGGWMKEYLFYPLSLSKGFARMGKWTRTRFRNAFGKMFVTCLAMAINFIAVGVWHGANWKYIAYGFYNGILIVIGILMRPRIQRYQKEHPGFTTERLLNRILCTLGTLFIVFIGRYFSTAANLSQTWDMLKRTFTVWNPKALLSGFFSRVGFSEGDLVILTIAVLILFFVSVMQERGIRIREALNRRPFVVRWMVYLMVLTSIIYFGVSATDDARGFIYAQF